MCFLLLLEPSWAGSMSHTPSLAHARVLMLKDKLALQGRWRPPPLLAVQPFPLGEHTKALLQVNKNMGLGAGRRGRQMFSREVTVYLHTRRPPLLICGTPLRNSSQAHSSIQGTIPAQAKVRGRGPHSTREHHGTCQAPQVCRLSSVMNAELGHGL